MISTRTGAGMKTGSARTTRARSTPRARDTAGDAVWKALADPTRRRVLDLLRERPRTTGELAAAFPEVTRFAVMKHLGVLEAAGLVLVRPKGRERWHHVNAVPLRRAYERWMRPYAEESAARLLRLQRHAEGSTKGEEMNATIARTAVESFDFEEEIDIDAPPEAVFDALTTGVDGWFEHRARAGSRVVCEPKIGGLVYEDWGNGEGHVWDVVTAISRPTFVRFESVHGLAGPVRFYTTFRLAEKDGGTVLQHSVTAVGTFTDEGLASYGTVLSALGPSLRKYLARTA